MQGLVEDKILALIGDRPVFDYSLTAFARAGIVGRVVVVYRDPPQRQRLAAIFAQSEARRLQARWVRGGTERQHSVARALAALPTSVDWVFIHDCARPLVRTDDLATVDRAMRRDGAACLAHPVTDTIKRVSTRGTTPDRSRLRTVDRSRLWAMETPQAFSRPLIAGAYAEVDRRGLRITDDTSALELVTRHPVTLVPSTGPDLKITRPADLAYAGFLVQRSQT
jgi:2-C-methyl-D-erythritol 4-phosphate cytidylyltransferase